MASAVRSTALAGNRQTCQQLHLLLSPLERHFVPHRRQHATYPRRELRVHDIEIDIYREPALLTMFTEVIGAYTGRFAHGGQHLFAP